MSAFAAYSRMAFSEVMAQWAEQQISARFQCQFGYLLPLHAPATLREKIFVRMVLLHRCHVHRYTLLTDKLAVRHYVRQCIGSAHLTTIAWAGSDPAAAPLEKHSDGGWIAKTNHGCGGHRVITAGDQMPLRQHLQQQLQQNYYWLALEAQYYQIRPILFIERLVQGSKKPVPMNYRLWCFQGCVKLIQVDDGSPFNPFYSPKWKPLDLSYRDGGQAHYKCRKPENLERMMSLAETLAAPFGFVRVDLYSLAEQIIFSELTFTPLAGDLWLKPASWDQELGDYWPNDRLV
jgi:hypothetical protein